MAKSLQAETGSRSLPAFQLCGQEIKEDEDKTREGGQA